MPDQSSIFIEFHALTSYAPANLNRDELGSPKTALFGGYRRLRISSQGLKRTWRMSPFFRGEFAEDQLGIRTRRIPHQLRQDLEVEGVDARAIDGLMAVLGALGRKVDREEEEE